MQPTTNYLDVMEYLLKARCAKLGWLEVLEPGLKKCSTNCQKDSLRTANRQSKIITIFLESTLCIAFI